ncbi:GNAT family N-acetyltransferase [Luteipulveratus mongoliensis]|uniref:N-acetyltransferase domain-containing protein n=1 Tax=Luteipulveratus mongoliensis TaxID=571913 RepID=A0A0K1JHP8_9MICO|nr:GNAT family N-acetyltransferase [Luteipulveratus mongoliensis]AKU16237.1 hypothetical protein VV02_10800 [Luteipulveratus mongoliensis]
MAPATFPGVVPVLADDVVQLRAHHVDDVSRIVEQINDARFQRWTSVPLPYDDSHALAFLEIIRGAWEDGDARFWAVEVGGRYAGTINYRLKGGGTAEVGYGLHVDSRGAGVMSHALRLVLGWAFEHDGVETMGWRAAVGNLASRRVAWANGFAVEGLWRGMHAIPSGHVDDMWLGQLHKGEPRTPRHPWWEPEVLESEHIRIRPWRAEDVPPSHPDKASELYNGGKQPTPDGFEEWRQIRLNRMADGQGVYWCIADAQTDESLGGIQLAQLHIPFTRGTGVVGYWLHPHGRGRGAIQDALDLVIEHAFAPRTDDAGHSGLGLHRLWAGTDEGNRASQRALRRAGFRQVCTERAAIAHDDRPPTGAISFELLDTDDRVAQTIEPGVIPVLDTERLRLRPWTPQDRPRGDQDLDRDSLRFMPAGAQPSASTYDPWLERRGRLQDLGDLSWCIADRKTGEPLGCILLFGLSAGTPGDGELGYWLYADARGNGYLQEAIPPVLEHAFTPVELDGLGLHRVHADTDLENVASQKLLEGNGFHRWGEDHQSYARADGSLSDGAYFELLVDDWRAEHDDADPPERAGITVPVLDGEGLGLRPWRDGDSERIVAACTDPVTRHWLADLPDPYTLASARAYIKNINEGARSGRTLCWCIADPDTDEALGSLALMGMSGLDPTVAEIGYWVSPDARGKGVATEATRLAIMHALTPVDAGGLGLRRLSLNVAAGNEVSARVPRRFGFTQVGTDRLAEPLGDGSYVDLRRFDLLATEWADQS